MMANRRADLVVSSLLKYVTDIDDVKGLGFCVTVEHAEFMSNYFNARGIPSMFLTGHSPDEERKESKARLVKVKCGLSSSLISTTKVWTFLKSTRFYSCVQQNL